VVLDGHLPLEILKTDAHDELNVPCAHHFSNGRHHAARPASSRSPRVPVCRNDEREEALIFLPRIVSAISEGVARSDPAVIFLPRIVSAISEGVARSDPAGFGKTTSPGARLYLLDDNDKITAEQVVFFLGS
jgi:hypothetical protein